MPLTSRRTTLFCALAFTTVAAGCGDNSKAGAVGVAKVWELSGLSTPESALVDAKAGTIYVSNVAGSPTEKDGNGFISKVSLGGKVTALEWVKGFNAPKGLAQAAGKLYVADIDQLIEIDIAAGAIATRHDVPGAQFLNDVVADGDGRIYVSDMATNVIWRLENGNLEKWLEGPELQNPNGLFIDGDKMLVASWGPMDEAANAKAPGHLLQVSLADKTVRAFGDGKLTGHLDGLEADGSGRYLVGDWMSGQFYRVDQTGKAEELLSLGQGTADFGYDKATKTVYIPQMMKGLLTAYKVE